MLQIHARIFSPYLEPQHHLAKVQHPRAIGLRAAEIGRDLVILRALIRLLTGIHTDHQPGFLQSLEMPSHHVWMAVQPLRKHDHRWETPIRQLPKHRMAHRVRDRAEDDQSSADNPTHRPRWRGLRALICRTGVHCLTHEDLFCPPKAAPTIPDCTFTESPRPRNQSPPSAIRPQKAPIPEPKSRVIEPPRLRCPSLHSGNTSPKPSIPEPPAG